MATYRADLLSDTLTRPTPAMREAMARADVGDDVFGEDPTVRALEERVAGLLGHEDALFAPTGSMANQLGLRLHVAPGKEMVADQQAHVVRAELGAAAAFSGITSRTWPSVRGLLDPAGPMSLVTTGVGPYQVETALVVVENTHNFGGGTVQPIEAIREVRSATTELGVAMHLDGARLWNAHVASGVSLAEYGSQFDTVSVCLSKGLGAPVGSVLAGSVEAMAEARIWRKRYGGGMRQVGILAAAGLHALEHHVERLADDHARARRFAEACAEVAPGTVDPATVETNIVVLDVGAAGLTAAQFVDALLEHGVRTYAVGPRAVRLVWHLDVDDAGTDAAVTAAREVLSAS
ncbi:low specificity L-threonine aldolase [Phycicoccus sp. HDW14]|uniref:threonine aldolase family protein n=1 Tax=Phycicoccus sp. HDW14 TaxID=2714941 RepID=UPI00140E6C08|nr:GntG family PLP-dependent aldolase [Phycicoccus sp. HDW14]QIM20713.1 low specificity L-threonine aldolase [Phycicoccus sp. HDW14]